MTCALLTRTPADMLALMGPGSQALELAIRVSLRRPDLACYPGSIADHWQWGGTGVLARSIVEGWQRHEHLLRVARNLTPEQREALWSDASPESAELRKVMR